jgi:hypothetical protein
VCVCVCARLRAGQRLGLFVTVARCVFGMIFFLSFFRHSGERERESALELQVGSGLLQGVPWISVVRSFLASIGIFGNALFGISFRTFIVAPMVHPSATGSVRHPPSDIDMTMTLDLLLSISL